MHTYISELLMSCCRGAEALVWPPMFGSWTFGTRSMKRRVRSKWERCFMLHRVIVVPPNPRVAGPAIYHIKTMHIFFLYFFLLCPLYGHQCGWHVRWDIQITHVQAPVMSSCKTWQGRVQNGDNSAMHQLHESRFRALLTSEWWKWGRFWILDKDHFLQRSRVVFGLRTPALTPGDNFAATLPAVPVPATAWTIGLKIWQNHFVDAVQRVAVSLSCSSVSRSHNLLIAARTELKKFKRV